jgi:hypothetical protein
MKMRIQSQQYEKAGAHDLALKSESVYTNGQSAWLN